MDREPEPLTALSPLHVVLPLRTVSGGKSRLGGALDAEEREELVIGMLLHTLDVLSAWPHCERIHLVSPDPVIEVLPLPARPDLSIHAQRIDGLNAAISQGVAAARSHGAASVLVLPADLPDLDVEALDELVSAADAGVAAAGGGALVAIVPSDARGGTNALLLRPPEVIEPSFGTDSFEAHLRAADAAEAAVQVVTDSVLGFDLDTPDDLERLEPARLRELMERGQEAEAARSDEGAEPDPVPVPRGRLTAVALPELPEVQPGDDLGALVMAAWTRLAASEPAMAARDGDVVVITSKVVSKAEGRIVRLADVEPRPEAREFAERWDKDARQVEVVLRESVDVLRMERGVIISRTRHGFVCANAGVDASNVGADDVVLLLPEDPDRSAAAIMATISGATGARVGVVVSDSFGRPWRWGITDVALGVAGFDPLDDMRGRPDTEGRTMRATVVAVADQLASTAELASGKTSRRPAVVIRGARLPAGDGTVAGDVVMSAEDDLFR